MATSPNFSWPEPDNTDLVKNGALAIRTAVNAIDSSMVDLKGGTTGQILAKATNTDMDFVWVANDVGDITAVTASSPLTGGGTSGAITVGIQDATTSVKGAVQLSDSTSTTSSILAATPTAVKSAFDLATTANTNSNNITMVQQYTATESVLKNIPSRVPVAEQLLKQAVYWIDAAQADNSDQVLDNQGWGAPALTTTLGSSTGADSNDPKFLDFTGTNYVYTPGVTGNYLSVPDAAALDITGDLDLRAYVACDDWTPSSLQFFIAKRSIGNTQMSYQLYLNTTGTLGFSVSSNGTTFAVDATSTVAPTVSDGAALWVRATFDSDNGASGNDVKFFTSTDGITYTQLGSTVTTAGVATIFSGTSSLDIGSQAGGNSPIAAKIYRAQIFNGIAGTKVLDVDTSIIGSGSATTFSALTDQTVTINRSTSGKKTAVVTHPVWLFGTDDYMQVADNDLLDFNATDNFTICFVGRRFATQSANQTQIAKTSFWSTAQAGYALHNANFNYSDGTTNLNVGSAGATGTLETMSVIRNKSTNQSFFYLNGVLAGTTSDTIGSLTNSLTFFIGKSNTGGYEADMEFIAAAVFRRVLTATEITTINNYYTARVGA